MAEIKADTGRAGSAQPSDQVNNIQHIQPVQKALMDRPSISIRARVVAVFIVIFLILCSITVAAVVFFSEFAVKLRFIEKVENHAYEIQQARRFEKNFFLYGTDLSEALANIQTASDQLERSGQEIQAVVGRGKYASMKENLLRYEAPLEQLLDAAEGGKPVQGAEKRRIEIQLRKRGAQILADAQELIDRERFAVHTMLHIATLASVGFLIFMFFVFIYFAGFIIRSVLRPLGRFMEYAARIGKGDHSPILPARKYRDEFSKLAIAINQMLSDLMLRQEQVIQSGKMAAVGTLTSGIAHELNNPLNNIGITTEALVENYRDYSDEERLRMLDQIATQVERASGTVKNLLDFTRKEQDVFTSVSVSQITRSTLKLVGNEMKLNGIDLGLGIEEDIPEVRGNPRSLQQVLLNLFLNAIQAMPKGGKLTVCAVRGEDGFVRLDVGDTGPGIPPENLEKVFDPFFTTKEPGEGTGLGLSVAYRIIEKHHGKITVTSEPGKGATFSIFLPSQMNQVEA
jgi:signal transduction histidine kinase